VMALIAHYLVLGATQVLPSAPPPLLALTVIVGAGAVYLAISYVINRDQVMALVKLLPWSVAGG
jgi:hypothetical protein